MCGLDGDLRSQLLSIAGTIAFIVIEDLALLDAFYLTISTMGFGATCRGFSPAGQVATVALVVVLTATGLQPNSAPLNETRWTA